MTPIDSRPLPTLPQLMKATAIALITAGVILTIAVLPAEYGIDPTGVGSALGLTKLSTAGANAGTAPPTANATVAAAAATAVKAPASPDMTTVSKSPTPLRSEEMSLTLQPGEGGEIKASMQKGQQFVFSWAADGGKVNFDMHGEPPNAGDKFTSYWKDLQQASASGTFVAPFDGTHGWYWRNRGKQPVTVRVTVSGFYEKLFQPK